MGAEQPEAAVKLAVVEILDADGRSRQVVPVSHWPIAIGRSIECDVVLDDPYTAPHHATLDEREGVLGIEAAGSLNGVSVGKRLLKAHDRLDLMPGDVFRVGGTRLRVRRATDALAPERTLPDARTGWISLVVLPALLALWTAAEHWLSTDPGGRSIDYLTLIIATVLGLAVWSGFWSLGSRLFRQRFDYWTHVRAAALFFFTAAVVRALLPLVAYTLGWEWPSRIAYLTNIGVLWALVLAHLTIMLPARRKVLAVAMGAIFVVGTSLYLTRNYQTTHRVFPELYVTMLAPPAVRLASPTAIDRFIDETRALKDGLDHQAKEDDGTGPQIDDDDE